MRFFSLDFTQMKRQILYGLLLILPLIAACRSSSPSGESASAVTPQTEPAELLPLDSPAPDFNLPATYGRQVKLADYAGKNLVLIFYPKDDTPGCTLQLCALRDEYPSFQALNAEGIASNPNTVESHEAFANKQQYRFPILADTEQSMAKAYHVINDTGRVTRTVYIIDGQGVIRYATRGLPSNEELRQAIQGFSENHKSMKQGSESGNAPR